MLHIKPKYIYFLYRLIALAVTGGGRVTCEGWTAALEPGSIVLADRPSRIRLGRRVYVKRRVNLEAHDGGRIAIGAHSFINKDSSVIARTGITIGKNCMIGEGVSIYDHNHRIDDPDTPYRLQGYIGRPVRIGDNVWIGSGAFIGPGVTIGDNAVIGARAVITKDVPADTVAYVRTRLVFRPIDGHSPRLRPGMAEPERMQHAS